MACDNNSCAWILGKDSTERGHHLTLYCHEGLIESSVDCCRSMSRILHLKEIHISDPVLDVHGAPEGYYGLIIVFIICDISKCSL